MLLWIRARLPTVLRKLIGIDIKDSVVLNTVLEYEIVLIDPQKAVELALQNRLEIREQEIQIELGEMSIKRQKAEGMIKSSLTAYYQKVGVSELGTDQAFINSLDRSASDFMIRPQNYGVGLTVSVPIIDWGEKQSFGTLGRISPAKEPLSSGRSASQHRTRSA